MDELVDKVLAQEKIKRNPFKPQPVPAVCNTHFMLTPKGIVDCNVPDFDPAKYKGINYNTRRQKGMKRLFGR